MEKLKKTAEVVNKKEKQEITFGVSIERFLGDQEVSDAHIFVSICHYDNAVLLEGCYKSRVISTK